MFQDFIKSKLFITIFLIITLVIGFCYWPKYGWKVSRFCAQKFGSTFFLARGKSNQNASGSATLAAAGSEQNGVYEEGKHFQKLSAKVTSNATVQNFINRNPGKIQVLTFFNYACFWCYRLHPAIEKWKSTMPGSVVFYRFPVNFHQGWDKLAKSYYVVEQLGRSEELDKDFFDAIHQKAINLIDDKILKDFFASHGVSNEKFDEIYNSFAINRAYAQSTEVANAFQVTLSPIFIVNSPSGSYLLSAALAGSEEKVMEVLNFVIKRETVGEALPTPNPPSLPVPNSPSMPTPEPTRLPGVQPNPAPSLNEPTQSSS